MAYYTDIFSPETYFEFLSNPQMPTRFKMYYEKQVRKLQPGDKLLCYVTKFSRWTGVLKVSGHFKVNYSEMHNYPLEVPVYRAVLLPLQKSIPIKDHTVFNTLSFTKEGNPWSHAVRNTLNELIEEDGHFLERSLLKQQGVDAREFPFEKEDKTAFIEFINNTNFRNETYNVSLDDIVDLQKSPNDILRKLNDKMRNVDPEKVNRFVDITLRKDSAIVNALKAAAKHKCQFPNCNAEIKKKAGDFYVEVAHIKAVSSGGKSILGNLVVLCPNHHKEFDLGDLKISEQEIGFVKGSVNNRDFEIKLFN